MATSLGLAAPEPVPDINNVEANNSETNHDPFKFSHGLTGVYQPMNYLFVNILITTVLCFTLITLCYRISTAILRDRRRITAITAPSGQELWSRNRHNWWAWIKRYFIYSPVWRNRHNREIQLSSAVNVGTLPSRLQFIILLVYVGSNVAYCFAIPEQPHTQRVAEFRGRCGSLAVFNLIFTILFALRNNPFIWLLHISYDTFNLFHRWCARIVFVESFAHILAWMYNTYHVNYQGKSGWDSIHWVLGQSLSFRWGLAAFIGFTILILHSFGPLRHAFYESFLTIHRLSIIVVISGVYYHLAKHALPQMPWAYVIISILAAEPVLRVARVLYRNLSFRCQTWTKVSIEALPGEATRVTFELPQPWTTAPGSFIHVYLPRLALWSSHPFSVAWSTDSESCVLGDKGLPKSIQDLEVRRGPSTISCVIRARTGMTRNLYNLASGTPSNSYNWLRIFRALRPRPTPTLPASISASTIDSQLNIKSKPIELWGAVEGPYGGYHSLDSYGTVILFAAGVGITHPIGFVKHLLAGHNNRTTATQKIKLVWSIQSLIMLAWIQPYLQEIISMPNFRSIVRIRVYVSKKAAIGPEQTAALDFDLSEIDVRPGRCVPQNVVDEEVISMCGAMCVTVCGPGAFSDAVRAAVRRRVDLKSIDFVEEAFSY